MNKLVVSFGLAAVLTAGVAAALPAIARAAGDAASSSDIILTRQAGYDLLGATFGSMKPVPDAKVDVKTFAPRAEAMVKWGKQIPLAFPAGSDTGHPTKAKPAVWSDRAGFEKAAANFTDAADKLVVAAKSGDDAAFAAQWKATGEACGACHKEYRAK